MAAGREIERKFLVSALPDNPCPGTRILQGYLPLASEHTEVRLRRKGDETVVTVKCGHGLERGEHEVAISAEVFEALWPLTAARGTSSAHGRRVAKDGACRSRLSVANRPGRRMAPVRRTSVMCRLSSSATSQQPVSSAWTSARARCTRAFMPGTERPTTSAASTWEGLPRSVSVSASRYGSGQLADQRREQRASSRRRPTPPGLKGGESACERRVALNRQAIRWRRVRTQADHRGRSRRPP